eukprot:6179655-Pleurochrysis_carterae.AAC.2
MSTNGVLVRKLRRCTLKAGRHERLGEASVGKAARQARRKSNRIRQGSQRRGQNRGQNRSVPILPTRSKKLHAQFRLCVALRIGSMASGRAAAQNRNKAGRVGESTELCTLPS